MDKRVLKNIILEQHNIIRETQINQRNYELEDNMCYVLGGVIEDKCNPKGYIII